MKTELLVDEDGLIQPGEQVREDTDTRKVKVIFGFYSNKPIGVEIDGVVTMFPVAVSSLKEKECCDFCVCPIHTLPEKGNNNG